MAASSPVPWHIITFEEFEYSTSLAQRGSARIA